MDDDDDDEICEMMLMISFYSPQMVATVNTTKYTIENDLTKKEKKEKNKKKQEKTTIHTNRWHVGLLVIT